MTNYDKNPIGIDTCEFEVCLSEKIEGFQCREMYNEYHIKCGEVREFRNKYQLILYLPRFIRADNCVPFTEQDFKYMDKVRKKTRKFLKDCFGDKFVSCKLTKMEVNITNKVIEGANCNNIMDLLVHSFCKKKQQTLCFMQRPEDSPLGVECTGIVDEVPNLMKIKCYNKGKKENLKTDRELFRLELVLLRRKVEKLFEDNTSIQNILTKASFRRAYEEYRQVLNNDIWDTVQNYLSLLSGEILKYVLKSKSPTKTYYQFKELIFDVEILRDVFKEYYSIVEKADSSRQTINQLKKEFDIPVGTIATIKYFMSLANM